MYCNREMISAVKKKKRNKKPKKRNAIELVTNLPKRLLLIASHCYIHTYVNALTT